MGEGRQGIKGKRNWIKAWTWLLQSITDVIFLPAYFPNPPDQGVPLGPRRDLTSLLLHGICLPGARGMSQSMIVVNVLRKHAFNSIRFQDRSWKMAIASNKRRMWRKHSDML